MNITGWTEAEKTDISRLILGTVLGQRYDLYMRPQFFEGRTRNIGMINSGLLKKCSGSIVINMAGGEF
jgi:hypothetical protein